jgi:hypothetical protein
MSVTDNASAEEATPTYLESGDPDRTITDFAFSTTAARDYSPVWLHNLADDVTLEGSMMNGAVRGPEAVVEVVGFIRTIYENQEFNFAGPYGEDGFLEVYNARVGGEPIGALVQVIRNSAGQAQHIAASYRPRTTLLLLSRLVGDHFAGTPIGGHFAISPE